MQLPKKFERSFKQPGRKVPHILSLRCVVLACTCYWTNSLQNVGAFLQQLLSERAAYVLRSVPRWVSPKAALVKDLPRGVVLVTFPHFLVRKCLCIESYLLLYMKMDQEVEDASTRQCWPVDQFLLCSNQTKRGYILPFFYLKYKCWSVKHFLPGWVACNTLYK